MSQKLLFNTATVVASTGGKRLPANEIHMNLTLTPLEFNEDGDALIMTFADQKGRTISKWISEPDIDKVYRFEDKKTGEKESKEDAYMRNAGQQLSFIYNLAELLGEDLLASIPDSSFMEYVKRAKAILDPVIAKTNKRFNVKVTEYNGKPMFPFSPDGCMEVYEEGKETTLSFTTKELAQKNNPTKGTDDTVLQQRKNLEEDVV